MMVLSHRALLALAAVADIAMHARPLPVAAKALAARLARRLRAGARAAQDHGGRHFARGVERTSH